MRLSIRLSAAALLAVAPSIRAQQPVPSTPSLQTPGATSQSLPIDRIVAVVGDSVITQSNVQERIIQKRQDGLALPTDSVAARALITSVVGELVDEALLLQKAKDLKVEVPDADVTTTIDKQFKDVRGRFGSEAEFRAELVKAGYGTPEEYRRVLIEGVKRNETITRTVRKLKEDGKMTQGNVTDAEVAEAFDRAKSSIPKREASVTWRQIIIAPKPTPAAKEVARVRAESLLAEIKRGADFELLAKRESMEPGAKESGGDLGWNRRGKMVPAFDRWMFQLSPGQLSPVVETPFGFHIIRVDRVQPAEVKARHILIMPKIDSSDVTRARLEADSVLAAWRAGAPFDSLAKLHHDFGSAEETTILTPYPRSQMPKPYQDAFDGKTAKDLVTFPIAGSGNIPSKLVVAQLVSVTEGGDYTLAEMKERLRSRLSEEAGYRRLMTTLRKGTYVSIRSDAMSVTPAAGPSTTP